MRRAIQALALELMLFPKLLGLSLTVLLVCLDFQSNKSYPIIYQLWLWRKKIQHLRQYKRINVNTSKNTVLNTIKELFFIFLFHKGTYEN